MIAEKSRDERHVLRNKSRSSLQVLEAVTWDVTCAGLREVGYLRAYSDPSDTLVEVT